MADAEKKNRMVRATAVIAALLMLAEGLLVLLSWLLAASPLNVQHSTFTVQRPLLSGQGIRWLAAHFVDGLQSPLLVWLLLGAITIGILRRSQLFNVQWQTSHVRRSMFNVQRTTFLLILAAYTLVILLLTSLPHSVLLSATGHLWPSPFSHALVPIVCLGVVIAAVGYGLAARTLTSLTAIVGAAVEGLRNAAPLLLLYILAMQFYLSLRYVMM